MGEGREMPAWECCPTLPWSSSEVKKYLATPAYSVTQPSLEAGSPVTIFSSWPTIMESVVLRHKYFPFLSLFSFADSDDSDTEGGLGNVERVVMRPPGHSGKAKRGHLCFDSSFETGNLLF